MRYEKMAVIGIGQMGASFALACREQGAVEYVTGVARSESTRRAAVQSGAADECTDSAREAVHDADLVYLSVPVGVMRPLMREIAPALKDGCLVTDAGSTKESICTSAQALLPDRVHFIGGHPMAGTEKQGPTHAAADLFAHTTYLLCPLTAPEDRVEEFSDLVRAIGAEPVVINPREHDRILAYSSHLPHLAAVSLSLTLTEEAPDDLARFGAGGLRDTTRIAAGSVEMWRDIFEANRSHLLTCAEDLRGVLDEFIEAMENDDFDTVADMLQEAHNFRSNLYGED